MNKILRATETPPTTGSLADDRPSVGSRGTNGDDRRSERPESSPQDTARTSAGGDDDEEPVVVLGLDETTQDQPRMKATIELQGVTMKSNGTLVVHDEPESSSPPNATKRWWDLPKKRGRRTGSDQLQKAYDIKMVATLVDKRGNSLTVKRHCLKELGWTESRWASVAKEVASVFNLAAKEVAVCCAMGKPLTDPLESALLMPDRIHAFRTKVRRPETQGQ